MKSVQLRKALQQRFTDQFQLEVGDGGFVLLTVIAAEFTGLVRQARLAQVEPLIENAGLVSGIIELYTPVEAESEGIRITKSDHGFPRSWQEAIGMLASGQTVPKRKPDHPIQRIVFYSYKGGVGRTTALIQTAFELLRSGKRVAVVDMDVEAPGLQTLLPPHHGNIQEGLVDYLWEQQTCFFDEANQPQVSLSGDNGIVYSIIDTHSKRPLFVVPAGKISKRYVQRLSVLTTTRLAVRANDPWFQFEQELWQQFQPDIMLIDARTGLNEWGGLSLLGLADDAFLALYPSEQNAEGIQFIQTVLKELGTIEPNWILSPVPEGIIGRTLVDNVIKVLDISDSQKQSLIQIPYHPNIAASAEFPVETALAYYAPIANYLLEESGVAQADTLITSANRLQLVRSLSFPERDAASILDSDFDAVFQKTADFERCIDDALWVIRGRKGTGKSTLYKLFTQHPKNAEKRSHGRLDNIIILSGHGDSDSFRPTTDTFARIQEELSQGQTDWLSLWRAYAVVVIYRSHPEFADSLRKAKLKTLLSRLDNSFQPTEHSWLDKHTKMLIKLSSDRELSAGSRDALILYNQILKEDNQKVWLLYDDLDQDIQENSSWQQDALGGLMRLIYDCHNQTLYNIRFKVFLREDIWAKLVFTNKSHFGDARTLLLQWGKVDLLRLGYRLAVSGSTDFKTLSNRIAPLAENELDEADEETLRKALAPLWGLKRAGKNAYVAQWVYNRLTDATENTYPRSLTILLKKSREVELEAKQRKNSPTTQLLSYKSLTEGLVAASEERCNAIQNEYPEFADFFAHMNELRSLFEKEDLSKIWENTLASKSDISFDAFVKRLEQIGLIAPRKSHKRYDYSIANLYVYGFNVRRTPGQRK
jgi:hypothetical protein